MRYLAILILFFLSCSCYNVDIECPAEFVRLQVIMDDISIFENHSFDMDTDLIISRNLAGTDIKRIDSVYQIIYIDTQKEDESFFIQIKDSVFILRTSFTSVNPTCCNGQGGVNQISLHDSLICSDFGRCLSGVTINL